MSRHTEAPSATVTFSDGEVFTYEAGNSHDMHVFDDMTPGEVETEVMDQAVEQVRILFPHKTIVGVVLVGLADLKESHNTITEEEK